MEKIMKSPVRNIAQQTGIDEQNTEILVVTFDSFMRHAQEWSAKAKELFVTSEDDKEGMKAAREARLAVRKIRIEADKRRKELKEESNRYNKAVQGVYNAIRDVIEPMEQHLKDQEEFAERMEIKRREEKRAEREKQLEPFEEFIPPGVIDIAGMSDEDFSVWIDRLAKQKRQAEEEAIRMQKEAEEQRRKEEEERARIREENERLRKEAEERERQIKEERAEQERQLQKERQERERIEAEKRKAEAEEHERLRKEAEEKKKAERAPDKQKLLRFAEEIRQMHPPSVKSSAAADVRSEIASKIEGFANWIEKRATEL